MTSHGVTYDSETDDLMADIRQSTQAIGHSTQVTARSTQVTGRSIQGGDYSAYDLGLGGRSQVL